MLAAVLAASHASAAPAPAAAAPASDLKPDPALKFGVLPNGMHYILMKNATPTGLAALRLRIGAGSLMERPGQEGLAHFIEHMAFNGSTHVPEGEMVKLLERYGLKFGADTNAFTSFDETVYELDLPTTNAAAVDASLMIMRETAGNLIFDPGAIDRERGVVLSEERTRDGPQMHMAHAQYDLFLKDQLAPSRFPIGSTEVLHTAQRDRFVAFYNAWYRPERATLVMVGDFDLAAMEQLIKAKFSDWKAGGPALAEPDQGAVAMRGLETKALIEPGLGPMVWIGWATAPDLATDSAAHRQMTTVRDLGFAVLNRRLQLIAQSGSAPFLGAGSGHQRLLKSADITQISITAQPGKVLESLAVVDAERRRLLTYGVTAAELNQEVTGIRSELQTAVAGAATRRSPDVARGLVGAVNDDEVFVSPADELAMFEATAKTLTPEAVNAAVKSAFGGAGPLLLGATPEALPGGQAALEAAFKTAEAQPVTAGQAQVAKAWPYASFGAPGTVASRQEVKDLGVTIVRFKNGSSLVVKPTAFRKDQIVVRLLVGHGREELPTDRETSAWVSSQEVVLGGFGKMTNEEMKLALADKVVGAAFSGEDDAWAFTGQTRPADLAVQMQLMTAYISDPGLRPDPFQRFQSAAPTIQAQLASAPGAVMQRDRNRLLHGGDPRFGLPGLAAMQAAKFEDLKALLAKGLAEGPVEMTVVGDVDVERTISEAAATIGALPPRAASPAPAAGLRTAFPAGTPTPVRLTHKGRADQGLAFVAWPVGDFFTDTRRSRQLVVLKDVLEQRAIEVLREKLGVTYSPQVGVSPSWAFPGYGFMSAQIETPTDKIGLFLPAIKEIVADLRDHPLTADKLALALNPEVEQITKQRQTNEYWLTYLSGATGDPRRLAAARTVLAEISGTTAADLQRLAREVFVDSKAYAIEVAPEAK